MATDGSNVFRAVPSARWRAKKEGIDLSLVKGSGPKDIILPRDIEKFKTTKSAIKTITHAKKMWASSLARKLAEKKGISLKGVEGTGNRGRVMMADVMRALEEGVIPESAKAMFGRTFPMSQMRRVIAKRMSQSAFTAPHIYFFTDVEMDTLDKLREEVLPEFEKNFKIRISINDFLIKAVALTIREFPMLNAIVKGEEIVVMPEINIGLAVALEEGLIVPAIAQADQLGLGEISRIRADLVERARTRKLKLEEIERGTFTISSLAQFDITFFTAILNPPQSGILSIGKTVDHLALKEGKITLQKIARFGLSVDHRIIDGVVAATFLQSLKNRLEKATLASL
ncbi:MAG TPA: 2-oxo acid dehydrogenase subunit E2 [Thermodesulfobacteriota bacterium]|nr:2-oxo acid dehydrogenase subunit E2 [Thermodesulfobacteriota bacterium]